MQTRSILFAALLTGGTLFLNSGNALADDDKWRYDIERRQERHAELIREGRRAGTLTMIEVRELRREQARIADMVQRARANGRVTWKEKQEIADAQDFAAAHIFEQRNDDQKAWWWHVMAAKRTGTAGL